MAVIRKKYNESLETGLLKVHHMIRFHSNTTVSKHSVTKNTKTYRQSRNRPICLKMITQNLEIFLFFYGGIFYTIILTFESKICRSVVLSSVPSFLRVSNFLSCCQDILWVSTIAKFLAAILEEYALVSWPCGKQKVHIPHHTIPPPLK